MKNIYKNLVNCGILGASMLLGATACSDDHFDVKEQPGANGGQATIWQSIEANPELSDVAEILKATRVMKDEKDAKATLTYSEWLNQPMEISAWLPKNGTFNKQYYLDQLAAADSLANDSNTAKAVALRAEYQVVNQFVKNHIALFNYGNTAKVQDVRLLNSKLCVFDATKSTFNGTPVDLSSVVRSGNGTLYALDGVSPFAYNIYDYMSSDDKFSTVYGIISDPAIDKDTFWPEGSTQGAMNEKGEIVYVDSVYLNTNELLSRASALIKSEDSIYVAMIPTNEAWKETFDVVKPLFTYGSSYNYDWVDGKFQKQRGQALKFNVDSLQRLSTSAAIIEGMFFNPSSFEGIDKKDSAAVINYMLHADSLISTNGTIYYNENASIGMVNPLFEGLTPIKASNGYVFAPANNRIKPEYSFIRRYEYRPGSIIASVSGCKTEHGAPTYLTVDNWEKYDEALLPEGVHGEVQDDWYHLFEMEGLSNMKIRMRLNGLPAGHYKIYAQMLPNRINKNTIHYEDDGLTPIEETPRFNAEMYDDAKRIDQNRGSDKKGITFNQDSVQNVILFEDFELKKSFMRLPAGYETFPALEISMSSKQSRDGQCTALSIAKIVVEPIRK